MAAVQGRNEMDVDLYFVFVRLDQMFFSKPLGNVSTVTEAPACVFMCFDTRRSDMARKRMQGQASSVQRSCPLTPGVLSYLAWVGANPARKSTDIASIGGYSAACIRPPLSQGVSTQYLYEASSAARGHAQKPPHKAR